jgi:hypothetical protein
LSQLEHPDWKAPQTYQVKAGGEMREYTVANPHGGQMTVQLDEEEAKRQGLIPKEPEEKQAPQPANKARPAETVSNK